MKTFLQARRSAELPVFLRVLKALPADRFNYRPHERSPSTADIVWTLALETKACCEMIDSGSVDWNPPPAPAKASELVAAFEEQYTALDRRISRLDDATWVRPVRLLVHGKLMREAPLGEFLWYLFFDAIHHRGQLSTYIRPMGGQVPSIYGPSGDDPGS